MEINGTTMTLTRFYRLFGFAPYKIVRNQVNQTLVFKLNRALCVYGVTLIIVFYGLSNYGLYYDMHSGHPIRYTLTHLHIEYQIHECIISIKLPVAMWKICVQNNKQIFWHLLVE